VLTNSSGNAAVKMIIINTTFGDCRTTDPPRSCLAHSQLKIIKSRPSDSGEYVCNATNDVGNIAKYATLTVHGK